MANALAGVRGGAIQVQGTINGYGERTGNCNLTTIIPNLTLKMGVRTLPEGRLVRLTQAANRIAEIVNFTPDPQAPYVGSSAFAHKAGLHVSAIARRKDAYEHVDPDAVGNGTRFVVSEMAGKATIDLKAKEIGIDLDGPALTTVIDELKRLEHEGYHFEAADGSLELLMRRATGWVQPYFELESYRVIVSEGDDVRHDTEAIVKLKVNGERIMRIGEGNGPVNALDAAVRAAIGSGLPAAGQGPPHRLQGPRARHRQGNRRGHPRPHRLHQRPPQLVHHRRVREHHPGFLAGPGGLARLRPAPHRGSRFTADGCARVRPHQAQRPPPGVRVAASP